MPVKHVPPGAPLNLREIMSGGFLRGRVKGGDSPLLISSKYAATDTVNNVFMKSLKSAESLLFFLERMIRTLKLFCQKATQEAHHQERQTVNPKRLKRFRRTQTCPGQPTPGFSEPI